MGKFKSSLLGLAITIFMGANGAALAEIIVVPREGSEFSIGKGFDSVTSEVKSECLVVGDISTLAASEGAAAEQNYTEIKTREELRRALGISSAGSFGYGAFSGSAKASYHQENKFDRQTYYLAASSTIVRQTEVLGEPKLKPEAKELLASNPEAFHQACGDSFVSARTVGGQFIALIKLDTSTEEEMRELRGSFKATYEVYSGDASMTQRATELFQKHNGSVRFIRIGGTGEFPSTDPASVKEYLRKFPTQIIGEGSQPFALSVTTRKYRSLLDAALLKPVNVVSSIQVMEDLALYYDGALDMRDNLAYVLSNPSEFPDFDEQLLSKYDVQISDALNLIRRYARACRDFPADVEKCIFLPSEQINLSSIKLPERRKIVYIQMASSNCPLLGHEQTERPRICRTAANGEEIAERTSVVFHYNPSYEEGLARRKVAGDIGVIKPLYNDFCLPKARLLDLYAAFGKDMTVWSVSRAEITSVHNYRMRKNMGLVFDPLIPKGINDHMATIYPADRYGSVLNQFLARA